MKKRNRKKWGKIILSYILITCFMSSVIPISATENTVENNNERAIFGTTYYVDDRNGDDNNNGISPETAWKSLDKLNRTTFTAGDKLLFKRGGVWTGQLSPNGSGAPGNPIIIASYGEGARPLIQGNNLIKNDDKNPGNQQFNAAVFFYNQEYWEITELEVTNKDPENWQEDHGKKYGVLIMGHDAGTLRHMYCRDLYVHNVVSIPEENQAGIGRGGIIYIIRGNKIETRWDDIVVENNQVGPNINHYGINFLSTWGSSSFPWESGIPSEERAGKRVNSTNIVIRNNYCVDIGNAAICPTAYESVLIEHNVCDTCNSGPNGNVPIWWENGDYTIAQKNEVFNSGATPGKEDSQAFDADVNAKENYIQYNYTHDNPSGAFFECALGSQYTTHIRYNISQNDGAGKNSYGQGSVVTLGGYSNNPASKMYVYNNTIYINEYAGEPCESYVLHSWGEYFNPENPENFQFRNNLVMNDGNSKGYSYEKKELGPYITGIFSNNAYGGKNVANIAPIKDSSDPLYREETNSLVYGEDGMNDPYFGLTKPGKAGTSGLNEEGIGEIKDIKQLTSGYKLASKDSPLVGAGIVIENNGGMDFWGNPVSFTSIPNIGADNSFAEIGDIASNDGINFEDVDVKINESKSIEGLYAHCNFGEGMWNVIKTEQYGTELYANDLTTEQQVCKIAIPEGRIFSGFKARGNNGVTIDVVSGTEKRSFTLTSEKKVFKTEFQNPSEAVYVIISSPDGASSIKLDDILLNAPEGGRKNVAFRQNVTVNGESEHAPSNAVDEDENTLWVRNLYGGNDGNHWLQVDLSKEYQISDFEVVFEGDTVEEQPWRYKIEASNQENFSNPVLLSDQTKTTDTSRKQSIPCNDNNTYRYVRITLTELGLKPGDSDPWPAIAEFRVFSDTSSYINATVGKPSEQNKGSNPNYVNDGDLTTRGGNTELSSPYIWTVDMGKSTRIGKTEIVFPAPDEHAPEGWNPDWGYKIEYSTDKDSWNTLVDYTKDPSSNKNKENVVQTENCNIDCQYIRVTVEKTPTTQPTAWAVIREFTAYSPINVTEEVDAKEPGQIVNYNLSYGKSVVSNDNAKEAEHITDNNEQTSWTAKGTAQIDYGKSYNFERIELLYKDNTEAKQYKVFVSNDKENWTEVIDKTSNTNKDVLQSESVTASGRFLLVTFLGAEQELVELKAFGTQADREGRKIMIVVPHQDDEMLMSGGIIKDAILNGDEVKVVIGTNGDYKGSSMGKTRIAESIAALTNLNVKLSDMIFLGYADNGGLIGRWGQEVDDSQLYQMYVAEDENKVIPSRNGNTQTYGQDSGKQDYHFEYTGEHADYTRKNFMSDLMHAIEEFGPTDIYSTSMYDMHSDHAYINLLVREAILKLQKQQPSFTPTLWDGIVHSVAGDSDLGDANRWPENNYDASIVFTQPNKLEEATTFDWNKRVSVTVPYQMRQPAPFEYSLKEQSLRLYKSQYMDQFIAAFSKYDEVFWEKPFTSLSYFANVNSSSNTDKAARVIDGIESGYIPAMKELDFTASAAKKRDGYPDAEWVSAGGVGEWIELTWDVPQTINKIVLYDRPDPSENITKGKITFDDGTTLDVEALPANGRPYEIDLDQEKVSASLKFEIIGVSKGTKQAGLAEIEVYGKENASKTKLKQLIDKARAIKNDGNEYTEESYQILQQAISEARNILNTSDEESVLEDAAKKLQQAMDSLVKTEPEKVDKQPLINKIQEAEAIKNETGMYTAESYEALQNAIQKAKSALETITTQEEVNAEVTALQSAMDGLVKTEPEKVDKQPLINKIQEAEAIKNETGMYTAESYEALQNAIQKAKSALETITTQEQVNTEVAALQSAMDGLVKTEPEKVDKQPLINKIQEAEAIKNETGMYTAESYEALQNAIQKAKSALETITTQEEVNTEVAALQSAMDGLKKTEPEEADKQPLMNKIQEAEAISNEAGTYTAESYEALQSAIQKAKSVLETITTQEEVNTEVAALQSAMDGLVKVEVPTENPDETQKPSDPTIPPIEIPTNPPVQPTATPSTDGDSTSTATPTTKPTAVPTEKPDNVVTEEDESTKTETTTNVTKEEDKTITETKTEVTDKKTGAVTETTIKKEETTKGTVAVDVTRKDGDTIIIANVEVNEKKEIVSSDAKVTPSKTETITNANKAEVKVNIAESVMKEVTDILAKQSGANISTSTLNVEVVIPKADVTKQINNNAIDTVVVAVNTPKETTAYKVTDIILPASVIEAAKDANKNLKAEIKNSADEFLATWSFKQNVLANSEGDITDVNLALDVSSVSNVGKEEVIQDIIAKDKNNTETKSIFLSFANEKDLPIAATINIAVAKNSSAKAGDKLYLYAINQETKKLEAVPNNAYKVSKAGNVAINIIKGTDYILLAKKPSLTVGVPLTNQVEVTLDGKSANSATISGTGKQMSLEVKLPITIQQVTSFHKTLPNKAITEAKVTYKSSDSKIISVGSDGTITSKKAGKATITTTIALKEGKKKTVKTVVTVK